MKRQETTITSKGQVTIPADIRSRLGLKPRDKVVFEVEGEDVKLRKAPSRVLRWFGSINKAAEQPEEFKKLREEFEVGVAEDVDSEDRD